MKTVVIQVDNSLDVLVQSKWSAMVDEIWQVAFFIGSVTFAGTSHGDSKWQNACWVLETEAMNDVIHAEIRYHLRPITDKYGLDILLTIGDTETIE